MEYDSRGRLAKRIPLGGAMDLRSDALLGQVTFTYTATGQRKTAEVMIPGTTPVTYLTRYVYDSFDRLGIKSGPERDITYTYDLAGNVTEISSKTRYSFDGSGNVLSGQDRSKWADNLYTWSNGGQLTTANGVPNDPTAATTYAYDGKRLKQVRHKNLITTTYSYDALSQLSSVALAAGLPLSSVATFAYTTSPSGRRNSVQDTVSSLANRSVNYSYDALSRLASETINPGSGQGLIDYQTQSGQPTQTGYDPVSNRRSRIVSNVAAVSSVQNLIYDTNDRLLGAGTPVRYGYDANGNTTSDTLGTTTTADDVADQYDSENRLAHRTVGPPPPGSPTKVIDLRYDADGNRVEKKVTVGSSVTTTRYLVDDRNPTGYAQVIEELVSINGGTETLAHGYLYGLDLIGFTDYTSGGATPPMYYFGYDGLGSVRLLFNGTSGSSTAGQVTDVYTYDAFGLLIDQRVRNNGSLMTVVNGVPTPTANNYRYTGEQWDGDLGLYYLRARFYAPDLGRFWNMDIYEGSQSDSLTLHKYLYAHCDPVNRIDPSGNTDFSLASLQSAIGYAVGLAANVGFRVAPLANKVTIVLYESISGSTVIGGAGLLAGGKLEKHHLVEKRFADTLRVAEGDIPSIALTVEEHAKYTSRWLAEIGRKNMDVPITTKNATIDNIWEAAQEVYHDASELLDFVKTFLNK